MDRRSFLKVVTAVGLSASVPFVSANSTASKYATNPLFKGGALAFDGVKIRRIGPVAFDFGSSIGIGAEAGTGAQRRRHAIRVPHDQWLDMLDDQREELWQLTEKMVVDQYRAVKCDLSI